MLMLHGAGLEADSDMVRHSLDSLPDLCAWVLFPTGVTPWSGDDWHSWGFADIEAAIAAIPHWIERNEWTAPGVDTERWLVSGHSNGGQGVWYALTHRPDNIIVAAPVSGYSSIQNYVPYTFWQTADPGRTAVLQAALDSYRTELLLENTKGIPILQQHGSADDNVPAYHSRLLSQRLEQAGSGSDYVEMRGKPHWWDGAMTTEPLKDFFRAHLNTDRFGSKTLADLEDFTVVSAGRGDMGPKNGVRILELITPGQFGRITVAFNHLTASCNLHASNVRSFNLPLIFKDCSTLTVNDAEVKGRPVDNTGIMLSMSEKQPGQWLAGYGLPPLAPRKGKQLGAMDAILRARGAFRIVYRSAETKHIALQISRNLNQYFAADTVITNNYSEAIERSESNIITIAGGTDLPPTFDGYQHPIKVFNDTLEIIDTHTDLPANGIRRYTPANGLGAIYLRPLPNERLELVVWAVNQTSLDMIARLVPLMTGTGQPDFVVADSTMLWKGVEGVLAAGWFGRRWEVTRNSYFA
jgi:predicted esterase